MSAYNPGTGWRAADQQDDVRDCIAYWDANTRTWNHWVREAPVPPLPDAPYTVIRVTWRKPPALEGAGEMLLLTRAGTWQIERDQYTATDVANGISSFEVLSEPRAVTAKAVLDRIHEESGYSVTLGVTLAKLADEFGAQS